MVLHSLPCVPVCVCVCVCVDTLCAFWPLSYIQTCIPSTLSLTTRTGTFGYPSLSLSFCLLVFLPLCVCVHDCLYQSVCLSV